MLLNRVLLVIKVLWIINSKPLCRLFYRENNTFIIENCWSCYFFNFWIENGEVEQSAIGRFISVLKFICSLCNFIRTANQIFMEICIRNEFLGKCYNSQMFYFERILSKTMEKNTKLFNRFGFIWRITLKQLGKLNLYQMVVGRAARENAAETFVFSFYEKVYLEP